MDFIAHKTDDGELQTLKEHIDGSSRIAQEIGNKLGISNIVLLSTKIHDMTKATEQFRSYILGEIPSAGEHAYGGAKLMTELFGTAGDAVDKLLIEIVSKNVATHHGLQDFTDRTGNATLSTSFADAHNYKEAKDYFLKIVSEDELNSIFIKAKEELTNVLKRIQELTKTTFEKGTNIKAKDVQNFYWGLFIRLTMSILRYSDMKDAVNFNKSREEHYVPDWNTPIKLLEKDYESFSKSEDPINIKRTEISNRALMFADHPAKNISLSMPTGSGKTLTALRYALHYCSEFNKDKIFYIAPFLSILGPNAEVIRKYLGDALLEHHSDIQVDDTDEKYAELCETWDNTSVVATSFIQFLNALFKDNGSSIRKFQSLINSVIILDEVQEIPANITYITNLMTNFLTHFMGATVVLCSASIPPFDKQHIPMLIDENHSITGDTKSDFEFFNNIIPVILPDIHRPLTEEEIKYYCKKIYNESDNLLFITNTKKAVRYFKRIFEKFVPTENIYCLSTRKCSKHLQNDIKEIKERLRKGDKILCISTQLIEAGVDISFQTGIRTLAGLDSLIQTGGRVNRNNEYPVSKLYIFNIGLDDRIENLRQIPYIRNGINDSISTISKLGSDKCVDQEALAEFFRDVYGVRTATPYAPNRFGGKLESEGCCLIDYLTKHFKGNTEFFQQNLKSFGEKFNIIDNYTTPVIVNYDETSQEIINKIRDKSFSKTDIRKSYRYTIGLSEYELVAHYKSGVIKYSEDYKMYYIDIPDGIYSKQSGLCFLDDLPSYIVL